MNYIFSLAISYLIGGIPFGFILGRVFGGVDIRELGSKSIGATNLTRVCGIKIGVWGYILDVIKGALPALFIPMIFKTDNMAVLEIIIVSFSVIGHLFPVYLKFRGGKGVSVALGGLLIVQTLPAISALIIFLIVIFISRYISLGSMIATSSFLVFIILKDIIFKLPFEFEFIAFGLILSIVVIFAHKSNITRLVKGEENKIWSGKKSEGLKE